MLNYSVIKGDIFTQIGYDIAFAIDATFACDVGFVKALNERFGIEKILKSIPAESCKWDGKGICISTSTSPKLHALVVKSLPNKYPDYAYIRQALNCLAQEIRNSGSIISPKIAMPKICCGSYDKREWAQVEKIIKEVFKDVDCEILIVEKE